MAGKTMTVKEAVGIGIASGVTANAINQKINYQFGKHEYEKATMYKRKLKDGRVVKVNKAPTHGVKSNQRSRQTVILPNTGGATQNGIYR